MKGVRITSLDAVALAVSLALFVSVVPWASRSVGPLLRPAEILHFGAEEVGGAKTTQADVPEQPPRLASAPLTALLERPLVSETRLPPVVIPPPEPAPPPPPPAPGVVLLGVARSDTGVIALIRGADGQMSRLKQGDKIEAWTIVQIGEKEVEIALESRSARVTSDGVQEE